MNFNNSKIIFIDQIDGFYVKVSDDLDSEYHIRTKNNMDCSGLNIISNKRHFENYLNEKVNIDTLKQGEKNLENRLTDYFLINNDILIKQLSYHKTIINLNQNEHELKNQIRNLFSYQYLKTDLNKDAIIDNIIIGTNNCYKSHSFVAILLEGENEIYIKTHSHFEQVIKIDESYFLLLHHYKPSTGWCVYSLYKISENKLINIWQDSSLSM